jgi:hypothetical protein
MKLHEVKSKPQTIEYRTSACDELSRVESLNSITESE